MFRPVAREKGCCRAEAVVLEAIEMRATPPRCRCSQRTIDCMFTGATALKRSVMARLLAAGYCHFCAGVSTHVVRFGQKTCSIFWYNALSPCPSGLAELRIRRGGAVRRLLACCSRLRHKSSRAQALFTARYQGPVRAACELASSASMGSNDELWREGFPARSAGSVMVKGGSLRPPSSECAALGVAASAALTGCRVIKGLL
ncbi:hypothetical protein P280DRAFT_66892 [Massarina eburnea CBS 473.64]|uniref:Uncharacterized protein n=1 Tax=Massarina eburnea CBS 473.64 TaxID=1395130 RepID=A0A6A6RYA0_9PLEO|nr:hypothetical protein P280DRAFT_66892 [Massarina eburnea CBS 473.64]